MADGLRDRLIAIQKAHGWVDREMAEKLGITRARWQQIRTGIMPDMGIQIIRGAAKAFPELRAEVDEAIHNGV